MRDIIAEFYLRLLVMPSWVKLKTVRRQSEKPFASVELQSKYSSTQQREEHPSWLFELLSSQFYSFEIIPSPQTKVQLLLYRTKPALHVTQITLFRTKL